MIHSIWGFLTSNYYLDVALVSWLSAQVIKTLLTLILTREIVWERMVGAGGMPSAHSALVSSLAVAICKQKGFQSPEFALALALAAIVMYDAMGVRRAAGEQAKALNKIIGAMSDNLRVLFEVESKRKFGLFQTHRKDDDPDETRAQKAMDENRELLKEMLGHTPLEVLGGAVLGIGVACLFPVW